MSTRTRFSNRGLVTLVVIGIVLALTAGMWSLAGCAPQQAPEESTQQEQKNDNSSASALEGQPVNWTIESDCSTCHLSEAESATDTACAQGVAHEAEGITCAQCHTQESVLSEEHANVKFGDKVATKATVTTVDAATCESCHGTLADVAVTTAESTVLKDSNDVVVNPHERPAGEKHNENPATCTDCHNNHSKDLPKDAMKYCTQCHHRGVFQCGTCHELRERSTS